MISFPNPSVNPSERGVALMATLAAILAIGLFAAAVTTMVAGIGEARHVQQVGNQAFYLAESGARYAMARLRRDGAEAVDELDGKRFTLSNGWGLQLTVESEDMGAYNRFTIDSAGFSGAGSTSQRQSLNGYVVEIVKPDVTDIPVPLPYATWSIGTSPIQVTGLSYIDSYDSFYDEKEWTEAGGIMNGTIRSGATENAVRLSGSGTIYGGVSVPEGADLENLGSVVNDPTKILGEAGIYTEDPGPEEPVPAPEEEAEAEKPTGWEAFPNITNKGEATIAGGTYTESRNFDVGDADVTVTGDLAIDAGRDFLVSGGSVTVEGSLAVWAGDDLELTGRTDAGLVVQGDADLQIGGDIKITSSQRMVVDGDLDLDAAGSFTIDGGGSLHIKGDAYIDVTGGFKIGGGGQLIVDGDVILKVGDGFALAGSTVPIVFGEQSSLQVYVESGRIAIDSSDVNAGNDPAQLAVFGSSDVRSVSINGDGTVVGAFHTPAATFSVTGSSSLFGAVVADSIRHVAGNSIIHFDEALTRGGPLPTVLEKLKLRRYWIAVGDASE